MTSVQVHGVNYWTGLTTRPIALTRTARQMVNGYGWPLAAKKEAKASCRLLGLHTLYLTVSARVGRLGISSGYKTVEKR